MKQWFCYNVYVGNKHMDMVKGYSEQHACDKVSQKWGPACSWDSTQNKYYAVHVPLGPILGDWKNVHKTRDK